MVRNSLVYQGMVKQGMARYCKLTYGKVPNRYCLLVGAGGGRGHGIGTPGVRRRPSLAPQGRAGRIGGYTFLTTSRLLSQNRKPQWLLQGATVI